MRISDWSADVCSSDLPGRHGARGQRRGSRSLNRQAKRLPPAERSPLNDRRSYGGRGSIFQTRQRLFAGIAKSSTSRSPPPRASSSTASKSRIPERGSRAFSHASKSRLLSQIGRQSRRERVCQFVAITVVYHQLKQKKNTKL